MHKLINKIISKIKGEKYEIDNDIPITYLFILLTSKVLQLIRGFFTKFYFKKGHKGKRVFIGKNVKIKCKKNIACGSGVTIDDNVYINALSRNGISIGNNVSIGRNSQIECTGVLRELGDQLIIEDGVGIAANAFIAVRGKIYIGKNSIFGPYVKIYSENHIFNDKNIPIRLQGSTRKGVTIGEDCWIGSNVTILDGVTLGKGCIVAAGAVVNKSFDDYSIIAGVPSKMIKKRGE